MIKYYIQTIKGVTSIVETEVIPATQMDDPSIAWSLKLGEYMYNVLHPKTLTSERWMSFAFYDTEEEARAKIECSLREVEAPRAARHGQPITEEEILARLAAIQLQKL